MHSLERCPENIRILVSEVQVIVETPGPLQFPVAVRLEILRDQLEEIDVLIHSILHPLLLLLRLLHPQLLLHPPLEHRK